MHILRISSSDPLQLQSHPSQKFQIDAEEDPKSKIDRSDMSQGVMIYKADLKRMLPINLYRPLTGELRSLYKMTGLELRNFFVQTIKTQGFSAEYIKSLQKVWDKMVLENYVSVVPSRAQPVPKEEEDTEEAREKRAAVRIFDF